MAAQGGLERIEAQPVGAVRVVQVARGEDQVRTEVGQQGLHRRDVGLGQLPAPARALVEGKVQEMNLGDGHAADASRGDRLLAADEALPAGQVRGRGEDAGGLKFRAQGPQGAQRARIHQARVAGEPEGPP